MLTYFLDVLFGCMHKHRTWPIRGTQRCLTCGAGRKYRIGERPGHWSKVCERDEHMQDVTAAVRA